MTEGAGESTRKVPTPGNSFGPYTIIGSLGAGGMGEVFRARDAKLNRHVALKFLPEEFSNDEQLLARFEREAKLLALVNHPNIATIFSIEEEGGHPFLVLELVDGETLAATLASGALPLHEALRVCRDVAAAFEAAHRKGIVHRDLKPANVMVTAEGIVKVLDFGIAKPLAYGEAANDLESTPSEELTATGTIIGTGPYMSPEQVRGKVAGRRADIWAFGCLMYQVLTGTAAFGRDTLADTLTSILEREPDWSRLPSKTPESIVRLMKRCLQKDPTQRLQAIGDARIEIEETIRTPSRDALARGPAPIPRWQLISGAAAMLILGVLIGASAVLLGNSGAPAPAPFYSDLALPDATVLGLGGAPSIAVSRDGARFVAVLHDGAARLLYRRDTNTNSAWIPLAGTDGAEGPFFSWDGARIGFFAGGELKSVAYSGEGVPELISEEAIEPHGGTWSSDDKIYFSANQKLWVTTFGTKTTSLVAEVETGGDALGLRWPMVLPDGVTVLYTQWRGPRNGGNSLHLLRPDRSTELLLRNAGYTRYSPSHHLVFNRGDQLLAVPFDPNSLTTTGDEMLLSDVVVLVREEIGVPFFDLAALGGTLVYVPGGVLTPGPVLAWMDATEKSVPEPVNLPTYFESLRYPRLSPDGRNLLVTIEESGDEDYDAYAGIIDLEARGNLHRLVAGALTHSAEWGPAGTVDYLAVEDYQIYRKEAYARGAGTRLTEADPDSLVAKVPTGLSAAGRLFFAVQPLLEGMGTGDVAYLERAGGSPRFFLEPGYQNYGAVPSPSGDLVAYVQRDPGTEETEVVVTPFPGAEMARAVSTGVDCQEPVWSSDDSRLFFRCGPDMIAVDLQPDLSVSGAVTLWSWPFALDDGMAKANYAYDKVQKRFLMVSEEPIISASSLMLGNHYHERLRTLGLR